MRSRLWTCLAALFLAATAQAHIGRPNVVFDGKAGSNPVRVVIRPAAAIPGAARVSVRAGGASGVTVQVTVEGWAPALAPPSVRAEPVEGAPGLFQAEVWLWNFGPCVVRVAV